MFIDDLQQNVSSVYMSKRRDQFDRKPVMVSLIFTTMVSLDVMQKQRR